MSQNNGQNPYRRGAQNGPAAEGEGYGAPMQPGTSDQAVQPERIQDRYGGNRGTITSRPSRDSIIRSYSEQAAARARNARLQSQQTYRQYQESAARLRERQERRDELRSRSIEANVSERPASTPQAAHSASPKTIRPLTTQESYRRTKTSMESYERERSNRDAFSRANAGRTTDREIIDARGSVDSRAFNELDKLVGYSIDDTDRPDPLIDSTNSKSRWRSHAGSGLDQGSGLAFNLPSATRKRGNLTHLGGSMVSRASYNKTGGRFSDVPLFVRIAIPVIVVLLIILLFILFG